LERAGIRFSVDKQQIGFHVALAMICLISAKSMIAISLRQGLIVS